MRDENPPQLHRGSEEETPELSGELEPQGVITWISVEVEWSRPKTRSIITSNIDESSTASSATWVRDLCSSKGTIIHMRVLNREKIGLYMVNL